LEDREVRGLGTRGFTLIEIVIALVIAGMAVALVAPAIQAGLRQREVRSAVRTVAGAMNALKSDAVRKGKPQELVLDPLENQLQVPGREESVKLGDVARMARLQGGIVDSTGVTRVRFFPNGSNTGVTLVVGDPEAPVTDSFVVQLDPLIGLVSVQGAQP
jgi:general secretion pathway protein H